MQFKRLAFAAVARAIACATVLAYFLAPALADEVKAGDLVITQAWSRATPGGAKVGGGYLAIQNKGSPAEPLVSGGRGGGPKRLGRTQAASRVTQTRWSRCD